MVTHLKGQVIPWRVQTIMVNVVSIIYPTHQPGSCITCFIDIGNEDASAEKDLIAKENAVQDNSSLTDSGDHEAPNGANSSSPDGTEEAVCAMEDASTNENAPVGAEDEADFVKGQQLNPTNGDSLTPLLPVVKQPTKRLSSVMDIDHLARCQHATEDVPEVKSFTIALLELAFEKQADISQMAVSTLQTIGRKQPATVLRTLLAYLSTDSKPSTRVRSTILTIMESTINPAIEAGHFDANLAAGLMKLAIDEMVSYAENVPDVQLPASNILVSIGAVYCKDVVELLCGRLKTNAQPHPAILQSLAALAMLNIYGVVPHLKGLLEVVVELLPSHLVKGSALRCSFATALAKFSEALLFYLANMERAPDSSIQRDWFSEDIAEAFEILFLHWLPCKVPLTCQEILEALGQMSQLLSNERLEQVAPKLLPSLIQNYRGPVESLYVSRCLALFLDAFFNAGLELSDVSVQELLQALFQQVTIQPDYGQPSTVKNHYEVNPLYGYNGNCSF